MSKMDSVISIFSRLRIRRQPEVQRQPAEVQRQPSVQQQPKVQPRPRPIALESSLIGKLPPEIILHITDFLPPESALAFSLCCRPVCSILGAQPFAAIKDELETRRDFFALLERDLPDHLACFYCSKLHPMKRPSDYLLSSRYDSRWYRASDPNCWDARLEYMTFTYIYYDFSYVLFQMTMKRYRQGVDYTDLLSLLCGEAKTRERDKYTHHKSSQARIVTGCLIVRTQEIFVYSALQEWAPHFTICPHYYDLWDLGAKKRYWWSRFYGVGNLECDYCLTDFHLDVKYRGELGIAIYCTKWQNLGEGRSPLDQTWQRHVSGRKGPIWTEVGSRGSICEAFEGTDVFEFDSLCTPKQKEELFRKWRWID